MQVKDRNRDRRSFGVLAVVCALLQLAVAPNVGIAGGRANLALVYAAVVALSAGGQTGVLAGFCAGLFFDLTSTGPVGLMALLLTLMCYLLGSEERNRLSDEPAGSFVLYALASLVVIVAYHLAMLLVGESSSLIDALLVRTLPTYALTLLAFLAVAIVVSRGSSGPLGSGSGGLGGLGGSGGRHARGGSTMLGRR